MFWSSLQFYEHIHALPKHSKALLFIKMGLKTDPAGGNTSFFGPIRSVEKTMKLDILLLLVAACYIIANGYRDPRHVQIFFNLDIK